MQPAAFSARINTTFTLDSIDYWVGDGENRAALVISWHDGKSSDNLVWGYRWPQGTTASGYQMIRAVAKSDPRFLLLSQFTSPNAADTLGYTIDGIGYCVTGRKDIDLYYDYEGASTDPRISFGFDQPNAERGQIAVPKTPQQDAANAIAAGKETGVIDHPFNSRNYGYPAYDYDHWLLANANDSVRWIAGWYKGYWSYFVRSSNSRRFSYSGEGASRRKLKDGAWDAWSFNGDMNQWQGSQPGDALVAAPAIVKMSIKSALLNTGESLSLDLTINSTYADPNQITWSIADENVATVDGAGSATTVTALGSGKTYVKATVIGKDGKTEYSAFCDITVTEADKASLEQTTEVLFSNNTLTIKGMAGSTGYIHSVYGTPVSTFTITADQETLPLNLPAGIYTFTGMKGKEKVALKFLVK